MSASSAAEKNTSRLLPPLYSGSGSFATKSAFVVSNTPHPIEGVFGEEQCAVRRTISKRRMNWSPTRAQKGRQNLLNSTQPNNHLQSLPTPTTPTDSHHNNATRKVYPAPVSTFSRLRAAQRWPSPRTQRTPARQPDTGGQE